MNIKEIQRRMSGSLESKRGGSDHLVTVRRGSDQLVAVRRGSDNLGGGRRGSERRGSIFEELGKVIRGRQSRNSVDSGASSCSEPRSSSYRIVILGSPRSGKTSIISQFLYDTFPTSYRETVEEMYRGEFEIGGGELSLNIQDTGGCYVYEFPSMIRVSLYSADAVIIVFNLSDPETFDEAGRLRDLVLEAKGPDTPIVIVGNKLDLVRELPKEETEAVVTLDWENGYVECSAKENQNISAIFKELLNQTKSSCVEINKPLVGKIGTIHGSMPSINMKRRQSMPMVPAFHRVAREGGSGTSTPHTTRRSSLAATFKRDSCRVS
ncbi:GTP-binding protein Rhes [Eurytemora carolleeae]|uniref:GTP-binding protein Rhes n=1 Tax=Eurytemora carolleeae TaxID=1294199 RepID=UPI000C76748F|nr:GTP-binding protein Rhes [Eurytemora carolleeae]XP_023340714.1 GTP-binding protein Rhes [Eurytemora carolleeae]|eukprot:XP_023340713.1 GTP-binding protein Rhes-like [Eurytemora affinis]